MKRLLVVTVLLLLCPVIVKASPPAPGDLPAPDVRFESATLGEFTIIGMSTDVNACNVAANHALPRERCIPGNGEWVIVHTSFVTITMTWNDLGLADPVPGSSACLWWYCYDLEGMPHGTDEIGVTSPYVLYLPVVVKGDA